MALYSLVLIDECFLLSEALFAHLNRLHTAVQRVPCVVLAGGQRQLGSHGGRPAFMSPLLRRTTFATTLVCEPNYQLRTGDTAYIKLLNWLRMSTPTDRGGDFFVKLLMRGHKAWRGELPTVSEMRNLLEDVPETTVLCTSRWGAEPLNEITLRALLGDKEPLGYADGRFGEQHCQPRREQQTEAVETTCADAVARKRT